MSTEKKRGRLSKEEEEVILQNLSSMDDEEIAAILNRDETLISKYRAQASMPDTSESYYELIQQLHKKFFWKETLSQLLDSDEIRYFENYWASLVHQFAPQGILSTDEHMMRDLILVDIHLNRSNQSKKNALSELRNIEKQMAEINAELSDDPLTRATRLEPLNSRANGLRAAMKALSDEYKILQEKKDKKYEQLKSTRQLRLEKTEKAGRSFFDLVKMLDSPEVREHEGRLNELYKISSELARLKFQELTKYDDDRLDRPLLTPEIEEETNNE